MKSQPAAERPSLPSFLVEEIGRLAGQREGWWCMPEPLMPVTGLGRKHAVIPRRAATCRGEQLVEHATWVGGHRGLGVV